MVVELAKFLGAPTTSDASRASLSKELLRVRAELLRDVPDPDDPIDRLKARAQAKRAAAAEFEGNEDFLHVNSRIFGSTDVSVGWISCGAAG